MPSKPTGPTVDGPEDAVRLLHELRVHQIELEQQNQELERTRNELEGALARYSELYDFAPVGYFTVDATGVLGEVNLEGARQLGAARAELVGKPLALQLRSPSRAAFEQCLADMKEGKSTCVVEPLRLPGVRLRLTGELSRPGGGYRVVADDITELSRVEDELQASRRMEAIGKLAGGVAHDFNNLLMVIQSSSDFLLEALPEDAPARADVLAIHGAGERAVTLTRQLLAFGRKQFLRPQVVELQPLTAGVGKMLRRVLRENVELRIEASPDLWTVFADPSQLEQVVVNLTLNAQDAMPDGGRLRFDLTNVTADASADEAALEGAPPGDYVKLSVTDTGIGRSDDVRAHIFEPFFSTKKEKGTGLGLATVYGIVKQSGAFISCSSQPGQGTVFAIFLPRRTDPGARPRPVDERASSVPPRARARILVVEDDDTVRAIACRILVAAGFEVITAANGVEALGLCREHARELALVLSDMVMPVMGGAELRRRVAEEFPGLEVLLMSGYPDDVASADLLAKPFDSAALLKKVDAHLSGARRPAQ